MPGTCVFPFVLKPCKRQPWYLSLVFDLRAWEKTSLIWFPLPRFLAEGWASTGGGGGNGGWVYEVCETACRFSRLWQLHKGSQPGPGMAPRLDNTQPQWCYLHRAMQHKAQHAGLWQHRTNGSFPHYLLPWFSQPAKQQQWCSRWAKATKPPPV